MNFPPQLRQEAEKWANQQGISVEQFVLQTLAEKIGVLNQKLTEENAEQANIYRKEGILVVDAELPDNFDSDTFIEALRAERIQQQMAL